MGRIVIDARGLEPPQPFELAMEAVAGLAPGGQATLLPDRMPYPLLHLLDRDGHRHEVAYRDDGVVEVIITRP